MLAALILAAGESRRMGTPKALLTYRGATFVEHLLAVTRHARVGITRVVLGAGAENIRAVLKLPDDQVVVNPDWPRGQLSSIQTAVRSLNARETEGALICPVDHPLVSADLVARLIEAFDSSRKPIVLPAFHGKRGHPVIFGRDLYPEILSASPDVGARQVVWGHAGEITEVPTEEEGSVLNLNDPDTLRRAIQKP
jgi:CTP:molybdopterin cytidylyltransferase MocA